METEFFCPRCNLSLKEVRMSHGVFWTCDKCGGRAVGLELLRRTFTPESINPLWPHTISGEGKVGPRCPSCRRPMIDVALSEKRGCERGCMSIVPLRLVRHERSQNSRAATIASRAARNAASNA